MYFNFCDPRLRPEIQCSTVSTEGYEVTNLISDSEKGFLAYSCIRPPVNIDITFLCNVSINHILIWPQVGCQRSSGFQLYAKTSNDNSVPYSLMGNGYLDRSNSGLLFYPASVNHETITVAPSVLKRYIKPSLNYLTTYISSLRICISRTENSVPAIGKIEVWGSVSPRCGKDIVASVSTLWANQPSTIESIDNAEVVKPSESTINNSRVLESLDVPECFLDAITYEIMTQPILLPSGKIIDQSTLLKHEETEALWGRRLTDPFTGLPFSEERKPVIVSALKIRIDKFLLENSNTEEVKALPRVLGRAQSSNVRSTKIEEVPKYLLKRDVVSVNSVQPNLQSLARINRIKEKVCHKLPVVVVSQKRKGSALSKPIKQIALSAPCKSMCTQSEVDKKRDCAETVDLTVDEQADSEISAVVPNLKRFNNITERKETSPKSINCSCCDNNIFYRLPCKHVFCRKVLTSINHNQCTFCDTPYKSNEVERIYE